MPRFAANLSFDPLKPMKPLTTGNTLEVISSPNSHQGECPPNLWEIAPLSCRKLTATQVS